MSAIIYLLQVSACLALFYSFYYLMLNRLTFFTINRYYLLFTIAFSFIIPLLTIPVHEEYSAVPVVKRVVNMRTSQNLDANVITVVAPVNTSSPITWMQLLQWTYWAIACVLIIHLLITLIKFFTKLKHRKMTNIGNVHVLRGDKNLPNGSFLNYIFLNDDELSADEVQQIVAHEMLHVKLLHSADRIIAKIVQIILWFNPIVYLYARSIEENHEFEVDREIARSTNKTQYADLLVHLSVANQGMLYHSFSKVPLKKRIVMLFNQPSAKIKRVVYVLVLPVIVVSCLAFANIKKDDIKNFSLVKSTKKIINTVKASQDNLIIQLNKPLRISVILPNARSVRSIDINSAIQTDIIPVTIVDTMRYSVFEGVSKNTKITINGKEYPNDILYEINNSNMKGISMSMDPQTRQPGTINLQTKDGQIIYLTAHEKENLRKEQSIPPSQFYTRLALTKENGERYDYIAFNLTGGKGRGRSRISPDDKVVFKIDGKLYDENEIKTVSPEILASFKSFGSATYRPDMLYQTKYKVVYTLTTQQNTTSPYGGGATYYESEPGRTSGIFRNYVISGYPVDSVVYKTNDYKTSADASLIELVKQLPGFKTVENAVYIGDKVINDLYIDGKEYPGYVLQGLKSLPANNAIRIKITSPDPKNRNPAIMYIISK